MTHRQVRTGLVDDRIESELSSIEIFRMFFVVHGLNEMGSPKRVVESRVVVGAKRIKIGSESPRDYG